MGGLSTTGNKLSVGFRLGLASDLRVEKSSCVKCQIEMVRDGDSWIPSSVARVDLPNSMLKGRIACQLKVTGSGTVAVSGPVPVPLEPACVPLVGPQGRGTGNATLSIGCLLTASAQASIARSLLQQLIAELSRPVCSQCAMDIIAALRPSCGWMGSPEVKRALAGDRNPLRAAVDGRHFDCAKALVDAQYDPRAMARDLRSPLTAAMELGGHELLLKADLKLRSEQEGIVEELSQLVTRKQEVASREAAKPWEVLAKSMFQARFKERADIYVLALEHCPTRARRRLLDYASCASIWQASLAQDLPELARKLAVWIGLSETNVARRILLNVRLEDCVDVLSGALSRAEEDERWFITSRVLVRLGAQARGVIHGSPPLFYLLELAESKNGFKELSDALLSQLGVAIDQWEQPTALRGEEAAECPICLEALWNATPSAFVISDVNNGHEESRVTCAHFFCFDCAVAQYIQQSGKGQNEYFCPICRNPAGEVLPVPDIGLNPRLWYRFIGGHLDQNTLIQAIEALLPLDTEQLRVLMEKHLWAAWSGGSDTVSESNFFSPGGVLEWIRGHQHELQAAQERGPAPSLDEAESWFRHWDGAQRGHLLRGEALRGLCEAF